MKNCATCDIQEGLERHHPNYEEPTKFITLCKSCHIELHRLLK